jgi:DNA replication and repair protein RecF
MGLSYIEIKAVRNLKAVSFHAHPSFNLFFGQNGSGKTSILEAIHLLGTGKSFRHHTIQPVIHYVFQALSVFSHLMTHETIKKSIGIEKDKAGKTRIQIDGESAAIANLAELLPIQTIHPDSDILITGSPKFRRQFLDWGAFHVEHSFFSTWQRLQRLLKQRSAALKQTQDRLQVSSWDDEYVQVSQIISELRKEYLNELESYFQKIIQYFLPNFNFQLFYQRGWPEEDLKVLLERCFYRDLQLGYTYYGPQRDDFSVLCESHFASEILSRGEQKLVVIALRLAQGQLLKEKTHKQCIYLLDDFSAELDSGHRRQVINILNKLQSQIFLTTIHYEEVKSSLDSVDLNLFHVEQGNIIKV